MWKISTIMLLVVGAYVVYAYYQQYQSMEKEIQQLRARCQNVQEKVATSGTIADRFEGMVGVVGTGLKAMLAQMPPA